MTQSQLETLMELVIREMANYSERLYSDASLSDYKKDLFKSEYQELGKIKEILAEKIMEFF